MEEMIERVARAIAYENGDDFDSIPQDKRDWVANHSATGRFRDVNEPRRDDYLSMACTAIKAMREPSFEMMQAMYEAMFVDKWDGSQAPMVGAGFEAAIDAALSTPLASEGGTK